MQHNANIWADDPVLAPLLAVAAADPEVEGLILSGSRGAGVSDSESDYDLEWVLTDAAYDRRAERAEQMHLSQDLDQPLLDVSYTCFRKLAQIAADASWPLPGYTTARILYDKAGRVAQAVQDMVTIPEERVRAEVLGWFDAYINAFYRSMKAWRRGNKLGGQLQAADSAMHLVRVLFAIERRWPPYHDRLIHQLDTLASQGWPAGYLHEALLQLVQTGDPKLQQRLEAEVEALLRARGFEVNLWEGEIDRVKTFRFD
jgi:Domain of unknown function (DUF4037)